MNILCSLSGHAIPAVPLENQGFRFSRCTRCSQDMIRSSTATSADWRPVPKGFRVAWRGVDLAMFAHRPRVAVRVEAAGRMMLELATITRIGCAVGYMRMTDPSRQAGRKIMRTLFARRRSRHAPHPKLLKRRWNFVFQVTVNRDLGFELGKLPA